MKFKDKLCYSQVVYLLNNPRFMKAVSDYSIIGKPQFEYESMAGYIETDVEFTVIDLTVFANEYRNYDANELTNIRNKLLKTCYGSV